MHGIREGGVCKEYEIQRCMWQTGLHHALDCMYVASSVVALVH